MAKSNDFLFCSPQNNPVYKLLPFGTDSLKVNSRYFTVNGKPALPVMGEFHFSRYPANEWEEELEKMRASGVQVVATYIFWIHHEQERGCWDFSGSRDLRAFLGICSRLHFPTVLRVGPFAHGEARNGGLPDWIVNDPSIHERTNDPKYLACVRDFFMHLAEQSAEYCASGDGTVIGIQIENEYGHVGGPSESDKGLAHMRMLKQIANEYRLSAPFYTATGWGGAYVVDGEMLPVQGGYVDAPWAQTVERLPASSLFLFKPFLDDGNTGSDHDKARREAFTFDVNAYPFLTAELGGGIQVTRHRRPVPTADDIEALVVCRLGSGANLIGYYMYHGGVNPIGITGPDGKEVTLQESIATGYPNDLPVKSYDFNAPIKENGELSRSCGRLRKLHMLLADFGWAMAPGIGVYPQDQPSSPEDMDTPRLCIRHNPHTNGGFLFYNNHQRLRNMRRIEDLHVNVKLSDESIIAFPALNIPSDACGILPYNLPLGKATLRSANAQPLSRIGNRFFFVADERVSLDFTGSNPDDVPLVSVLTSNRANNAYKLGNALYVLESQALADVKGDYSLPISGLYQRDGDVYITACRSYETISRYCEDPNEDTCVGIDFHTINVECSTRELSHTDSCVSYSIKLDNIPTNELHELFLQIDYLGDMAELYQDGNLIADWFTTGEPWRVALRRYGYGREYELRIYAPDRAVYYDKPIETGLKLKQAFTIPQYSRKVWPLEE